MIRLNNDYNRGAHPAILEALQNTNENSYGGYGIDEWCEKAADEIRKHLGKGEFDIHFMLGGTQVNYTACALTLRPYQSIVSAESGHINVHETGAVENTGHKIEALPAVNGKITAEALKEKAESFRNSDVQEHITEPKMVFISFPSETGTIYSKKELEDIRKVCDEYHLYMYVDGARLSYGLMSEECDISLEELSEMADMFYIGGTKCGALFGEAVVIRNDDLKRGFRSYMKQNGGMLAKGWLLGLQFYTLFKDNLYFKIGKSADRYAMKIREAFREAGVEFNMDSPTNQQFVLLDKKQAEYLGRNCIYENEGMKDGKQIARFCTSWSTTEDECKKTVDIIRGLKNIG